MEVPDIAQTRPPSSGSRSHPVRNAAVSSAYRSDGGGMRGMRPGLLVETIYDAAADPDGWPRVMAEIGTIFRTGAETFYSLAYPDRAFPPVHLAGPAAALPARSDE